MPGFMHTPRQKGAEYMQNLSCSMARSGMCQSSSRCKMKSGREKRGAVGKGGKRKEVGAREQGVFDSWAGGEQVAITRRNT